MKSKRETDPWAEFWSRSRPAGEGGCLPHALQRIDDAETAAWQDFAAKLPRRGRVLDLATGDGVVLKKIARIRQDLNLLGVDSSPSLPQPPKGISLRAGVPLEKLPFPDRSFDGVTSQFGFEYSNTDQAAAEVGRVLRPRGRFQFVMHRSEGPILKHNLPRREALLWVLSSGFLERAKDIVRARKVAAVPTPTLFADASREADHLFPRQGAGRELLEAIIITLNRGRNSPTRTSLEVLRELEEKARNEVGRIDSLRRAACDRKRIEVISKGLVAHGLQVSEPGELCEVGEKVPFAWLLAGLLPTS